MKSRIVLCEIYFVVILTIFCMIAETSQLRAQETYPNRPITMMAGYSAGGTTDLTIKALSNAVSKILGQPIPVINKPAATFPYLIGRILKDYRLEPEGLAGFIDASKNSGASDRADGVQTFPQHLYEDSLFDCEHGASDHLSVGWL